MGTQGIKTDAITQCYFTPQFLAWSVILHGLEKILKPLEAHLVIRAALGGLGLGLAGAFCQLRSSPVRWKHRN